MKKLLIILSVLTLCSCSKPVKETVKATETTTKAVETTTEVATTQVETTVAETEKKLDDVLLSAVFEQLKTKIPTLTEYVIFDSKTDPNGVLGRPKQYVQKGEGWDSRKEIVDKESDNAIDIEVFKNKEDCQARYEYLQQFVDASMGAFGLHQYIYKYDLVIFRVDYGLTPEEAQAYKQALDEILGEESVQFE